MSHYTLTEEQQYSIQKARLALSATALLVDEAGDCQPPSAELAALLNLIAESIPDRLRFVPGPV